MAGMEQIRYVTPELVEEVMGVERGSLGSMGWLLIQEDAKGTSRELVAKAFGCSLDDLTSLVFSLTGTEDPVASKDKWQIGVITIAAANRIQATHIGSGWDAVEAMAVDKLARSLDSMQTYGDPMQMLQIAKTANGAARRSQGEKSAANVGAVRPAGINVNIGIGVGEAGMELHAGNLGTLKLNLSPRVRAQLENPNRVIDAEARRVESDSTAKGLSDKLSMLTLKDTRMLTPEGKRDAAEKATAANGLPDYDFSNLLTGTG